MAVSAAEFSPRVGFRSWAYSSEDSRDLRIDFIRGAVMMILLTVHLDVYSGYTLFAWGRLGLISGAEGFAILSGVVLGFIHRRRLEEEGWLDSSRRMTDRAIQLYRVNLAVILSIWALSLIPFLDAAHVMTFKNWGNGEVYSLYPASGTPLHQQLAQIITLRAGPHQIQILGLYTVLLTFAPLAMWLFHKNRTPLVLALSWGLYFVQVASPGRPSGAQFEYAFPILAWQLLFFHGLAAGYHRAEILRWIQTLPGKMFVVGCCLVATALFAFVQNDPNPGEPSWARVSLIPADQYRSIVSLYGQKSALGLLRLLNDLTLLVAALTLLTFLWRPIHRLLGWFLIPLGQASLYVFIVHVPFVWLLFNIPFFADQPPEYHASTFAANTVAHSLIFMAIWMMVKSKFLFRWIPR